MIEVLFCVCFHTKDRPVSAVAGLEPEQLRDQHTNHCNIATDCYGYVYVKIRSVFIAFVYFDLFMSIVRYSFHVYKAIF